LHFISVTTHDVAMHAVAVNSYLFQKRKQTNNLSLICFRIDHSAKTIPFVLRSFHPAWYEWSFVFVTSIKTQSSHSCFVV